MVLLFVLFTAFPFLLTAFYFFPTFLYKDCILKRFVYLNLCYITADLMFFRCEETTYTESNSRP